MTTKGHSETALLQVCSLQCGYGPISVLHGVSLQVKRGAIVAVLGANGAGKSTLLKAISGVLTPQRGSIEFDGRRLDGVAPHEVVQMGIAHVPEGREIFQLLTVRENLIMGSYSRKDRDAVANEIESIFRAFPILRERAEQPAGLLSGGQQQMLAISRAVLARPKMILLDEPSLGLSPKLTKEIFEIIVRINREEGTSILVVEQNANMALNAADEAFVLENGRVILHGTCGDLRNRSDIQHFYMGTHAGTGEDQSRAVRQREWQ